MRWVDVDVRLVGAGLVAGVAAIVILLVTSPAEKIEVVEAASPLPSGVPLEDLDLGTRLVHDPTGWLRSSDLDRVGSHVLGVSLDAGSPIPETLVMDPAGHSSDVIGLALPAAASVHGHIDPGDLVDIYSVDPTELLASSVAVLWVDTDGGSFGSEDVRVLLAVDVELAPLLVASARDGLHLVRRGR